MSKLKYYLIISPIKVVGTLSLGLAQRLHDLQKLPPDQLAQALSRREALLRLVDPAGLGEFRWLLFGRGESLADFSLAGCSDKSEFAPG